MTLRNLIATFVGLTLLAWSQTHAAPPVRPVAAADYQLVDRLTWGANASELARFQQLGRAAWIEAQLRPATAAALPPAVAAVLDAMAGAAEPMGKRATEMEAVRYGAVHTSDLEEQRRKYAPYQMALRAGTIEVQARTSLRDLYSQDQLREQMTWFWFNHFNVRLGMPPLPLLVGDYVETAIRPRALGRFCDLVDATLRHPAMLIYLNNASNMAGRINENHARELLELHTMGIGSGYSQTDVQELAKVLTGAAVDLKTWPVPDPGPGAGGSFRDGLFVFDPARHVGGGKTLLGAPITARGYGEISEATAILCRQPATARRIVTKIARFLVADAPPPALVDQMTATFVKTDGDITAVLRTMIGSPEFEASLGTLFKDPQHYVTSALRLAFDGRMVSDTVWMARQLAILGQPLYGRGTPDGYPLDALEWSSSGQLGDRFKVADAIGRGAQWLFVVPGQPPAPAIPPELQAVVARLGLDARLAPETRAVLAEARTPREWNMLFLSSPEFMRR